MYLLGATLTKLLATLAAVMTVTAGLPGYQCRCPDGRVKLFCLGQASSPSGCCCAGGCPSAPEAKPCCCGAKRSNARGPKAAEKRSCCAHPQGEPTKAPEGDGHRLAVKAPCCVKTAVADAPVYTVENTGTPAHQPGDLLAVWQPVALPSGVTPGTTTARPPPWFLAAPRDLIVLLGHFRC